MSEKIVVQNLTKVFGNAPGEALALLDQGLGKDEIFERTGQSIGVQNACFSVREGEIFVIMGLSGSGKSTLVRLLNRLINPTRGEILVDGRDIAALNRADLIDLRRRDMAMVFQSFALMPHLTVAENAAFGLGIAGVSKTERRKKALDALEQVGLAGYGDSYPRALSGGMQQRVGLARALAVNPSVMLMDEAFSALDPLIRAEMQDELLRLQEQAERTIVFISHDLDEAMRLGDRIAVMENGRIVQVGTPDEILNNPADDYVHAFFRGVDVSRVLTAKDICRRAQVTVIERHHQGVAAATKRLQEYDRDFGFVVDKGGRFHGIVTVDSLRQCQRSGNPNLAEATVPNGETVAPDALLSDILDVVANDHFPVAVVDEKGRYLGAISKAVLLKTLSGTG